MPRLGFGRLSEAATTTLRGWEAHLDDEVARLESELVAVRRHLHAHPEPSGEEVQTSRFLCDRLEAAGLQPRLGRNDIGIIVDLDLGDPPPDAPLIAMRADLDALRVPDQKTVEYASRIPGVSHSCGHDAHATILLGAALAANTVPRESGGAAAASGARFRLLFQPAEETCEGAAQMVEAGAMQGVSAILGLHVDPERQVGRVGLRYGVLTAHCDEVRIFVEGHGGHAARPHHAVDPVAAAAHLVSTLYEFLPRSVDSRSPSVLTIGQISGGYAPNVIPECVELHGSLRTTELESRGLLKQRIAEICAGAEQSSGAGIRVQFSSPLGAVRNDSRVAAALEEASRRVLGVENVEHIDQPSMGGEDFSVYLDHAPGALLRLGCANPRGEDPFLHSPMFDLDERTLAVGTRILVRAALLLSLATAD